MNGHTLILRNTIIYELTIYISRFAMYNLLQGISKYSVRTEYPPEDYYWRYLRYYADTALRKNTWYNAARGFLEVPCSNVKFVQDCNDFGRT